MYASVYTCMHPYLSVYICMYAYLSVCLYVCVYVNPELHHRKTVAKGITLPMTECGSFI